MTTQIHCIFMACLLTQTFAFLPAGKESYVSNDILRNVVDRIIQQRIDADSNNGNEAYVDFAPIQGDSHGYPVLDPRSSKDFESAEFIFPGNDYDLPDEGVLSLNPSIRDQEYLQHSSLWGNKYVSGGAGEGKQFLKPQGTVSNTPQVKSDSRLPAYCNPPNPCPVGVGEEEECLSSVNFENTAAFSRRYQASQDCMCDTEHMFSCSSNDNDNGDSIVDQLIQHSMKSDSSNPFLLGERLPVAAKKGQRASN